MVFGLIGGRCGCDDEEDEAVGSENDPKETSRDILIATSDESFAFGIRDRTDAAMGHEY